MQLTNQQVEEAVIALEAFNPPVSFRAKMRLSRNLRKLANQRQEKEYDRVRLCYSIITDKTKKPEPGMAVLLTADEQIKLQPEFRQLMAQQVEVEVHPIEIYDSTDGKCPADPDLAIDLSKVPIPNDILARLLDVVFFEVK